MGIVTPGRRRRFVPKEGLVDSCLRFSDQSKSDSPVDGLVRPRWWDYRQNGRRGIVAGTARLAILGSRGRGVCPHRLAITGERHEHRARGPVSGRSHRDPGPGGMGCRLPAPAHGQDRSDCHTGGDCGKGRGLGIKLPRGEPRCCRGGHRWSSPTAPICRLFPR